VIIEIHPYDVNEFEAGLGNKLRTIFSFCNYCEINGFKLKIKWNYFYKLFPNILDNPLFTDKSPDIIYGPPLFYPLGECNNCHGGCKCDIDVNYYSPTFPIKKYFDMLIPNNNILNKIEELKNKINISECFGVHIRENDFINWSKVNKLKIPTDNEYIKNIKEYLKYTDFFYFTTDNPEKYSVYSNIFGSCCKYWSDKNLDRTSNENFIDAYIDMVFLSKTKFIIANKNSTFSQLSSRINNIPLIGI